MTLAQLEKRVESLEAEIRELRAMLPEKGAAQHSWLGTVGRFADDPTFEEAVRLGREYRDQINRESLEELDRQEREQKAREKKRKKPKPRKSNARA